MIAPHLSAQPRPGYGNTTCDSHRASRTIPALPEGPAFLGTRGGRSRDLLECHVQAELELGIPGCPVVPEVPPLPVQTLPGSFFLNPLQDEGGEGRTGTFPALNTPGRSPLSSS